MGILKKERIWFILVGGKKEGPYLASQLRSHPKVSPDTLVWKKGFSNWCPVGQVKELKEIFKDRKRKKAGEDKKYKHKLSPVIAKTHHHFNPSPFFWGLLLLSVVLLYVLYRFWTLS